MLGSISLIFICTFGILIALYCFSGGKNSRLPDDSLNDKLDYSYAEDQSLMNNSTKESEIEEQESSFTDNVEYRPPIITQLAQNNDSNN